MNYIALCGNKQSGKDTIADYLIEKHGFIKYSFAEPVKKISKVLFSLSDNQLNGNYKEIKDERWNLSPREIMQRLGTEFGQYYIYKLFPELKGKIKEKELWLEPFKSFLEQNKGKKIVIADLRFKHEYEFLKSYLFNIIKVERNTNLVDLHPSENEFKYFKSDFIINNNKSKIELYNKIDTIIEVPF